MLVLIRCSRRTVEQLTGRVMQLTLPKLGVSLKRRSEPFQKYVNLWLNCTALISALDNSKIQRIHTMKYLVAIVFALLATGTWARDFTWEKFGYALSGSTLFYSGEPLVSTPAAACNTPPSRPLSFCYDQALKRPYCVLGRGSPNPCGNADSTQDDLNSGYVDEVCTRWPLLP